MTEDIRGHLKIYRICDHKELGIFPSDRETV